MFGYVKPLKDELKIREYNVYRSYYCGLCYQIEKEFNFIIKMGLSYDFAFLALFLSALNEDEKLETKKYRCPGNPLKKRDIIIAKSIIYAAHMNALLFRQKLKDDWRDDRSIVTFILMGFYRCKKAEKLYPEKSGLIIEYLNKINKLEKEKCGSVDSLAHYSGLILKEIFTADHVSDNEAIGEIGYHVGRWIYIIDACEDLDKDIKKKRFNPFIYSGDFSNLKSRMEISLYNTLSKIADLTEQLTFYRNKEIVMNVIYLGMRQVTDDVLANLRS